MSESSLFSFKQPPIKRTPSVKAASDQSLEEIVEKNGKFIQGKKEHENASQFLISCSQWLNNCGGTKEVGSDV